MPDFGVGEIAALAAAAAGVGGTIYSMTNQPKAPAVPPPPGASMISQAGEQANAAMRRRQAAAGGLMSNVTGAGFQSPAVAPAATGPTSGGKTQSGQ